MASNANSFYIFRRKMLIFGTIIAYYVYIATNVSDRWYYLGDNAQSQMCQIYVKSL